MFMTEQPQSPFSDLGRAYEFVRRQEYRDALREFSRLADGNDPRAQYELGNMICFGLGTKADPGQAFKWHLRAAENGLAKAQFAVGFALELGRWVPRDEKAAVGWYEKAARQGHRDAMVNLADMHRYGLGTDRDNAKAWFWKRIALDSTKDPGFLAHHEADLELIQIKMTRGELDLARIEYRNWCESHPDHRN